MKRQWLLLLFPVALIGILLAVKHFAGKRGNAGSEATLTKPAVVLKNVSVEGNAPLDLVPKSESAKQGQLAPEVVEKVSGPLEGYIKDHPDAPDIVDAYFNLGNTYYQGGQYQKAIEPLLKAIERHPYDADAHFALGNVYDKLKRYKEAAQEFEQLTKIEPKNDMVYYNLGNAYVNQNKVPDAIERYKQALALNPKNAAAYDVLGIAYGRQRMPKEASEAFQQAVSLDPNNPQARYYLGVTKFANGDRKGAMDEYATLQKLSPQYADELNKKINP